MEHREIATNGNPSSEPDSPHARRSRRRADAEARRAMRRVLDEQVEVFELPADQPGLHRRTVLAGCRASWHESLSREARARLGASVHAFDDPLALICAACEILARGGTIDGVILESAHETTLGFRRDVAPGVPVILVGARDDLQARIRAATGGAAAFLARPVSVREIVRVAGVFTGPDAAAAGVREIPIPLHLIGDGKARR